MPVLKILQRTDGGGHSGGRPQTMRSGVFVGVRRLPFPVAFAQRVVFVQCGVQATRVEVGVYLRGRDGFVAEQFLYLADVGPAREQVGGETVAEGVRTHLLVDSGGRSGALMALNTMMRDSFRPWRLRKSVSEDFSSPGIPRYSRR